MAIVRPAHAARCALDASPVATPTNRMPALEDLALFPSQPSETRSLQIAWNDLRGHFDAIGAGDPYREHRMPNRFQSPLATMDPLSKAAFVEDLHVAFGFRALDVHRIITVGVAPNAVTIYRGGIDRQRIEPALTSHGYTRRDHQNVAIYTIGKDGDPTIRDNVSQVTLAEMNAIAVLDGDTIACSATVASLKTLIDSAMACDASLIDADGIRPAIALLPDDTASTFLIGGPAVSVQAMNARTDHTRVRDAMARELARSSKEVGTMPAPMVLGGGVKRGAVIPNETGIASPAPRPDQGDAWLFAQFDSESDAADATDVIAWRTMQFTSPFTREPYADSFGTGFGVQQIRSTVRITLGSGGPARWRHLLTHRDLLFFAY